MEKGYLSLVLHAHLPYVHHPETLDIIEEEWLFEAITETYLPLLEVFEGLVRDGVPFRLTLSLSPPLLAMFNNPFLQKRYLRHMRKLIALTEKELDRTQGHFHYLAGYYHDKLTKYYEDYYYKYNCNLTQAFKKIQDAGGLELITSAATHGYLPLLAPFPEAIRAQIKIAADYYEENFHCGPQGIWLPECGYYPGHDQYLAETGIKYFFVDNHGILFASKLPRYANFAPLECPSGVAVFGRDMESSKQVWSSQEGYPGDYDYREFYRDIGYDLDYQYIKPFLPVSGIRKDTGIKYYRITGKTHCKEPYMPDWAREKAAIHAGNFMYNREKQIEFLASLMDRQPIVISPYDAELFGHWWYEGPQWLDYLIRKIAYDQKTVKLITPGDYLKIYSDNQPAIPAQSSWGEKGYNQVWLDSSNQWAYKHVHYATEKMIELANKNRNSEGIIKRALNQAAREVLLAQSSDWAFIMKTGTMVEYAQRRVREHIGRFLRISQQIEERNVEENWLSQVEIKDNIFPRIDYLVYCSQ